jgi:hypothetical protein
MDSSWILWVILGAAVVIALMTAAVKAGRKAQLESYFATLESFTDTRHTVGVDGNSAIAFNESKRRIGLLERTPAGQPTHRDIAYADVISCELHEDGIAITKTSRSSQLGGALVGGLVFGGLGAVVGGLSGKRVSADKVRRIDLRLLVNDTASPQFSLCFLDVEAKQGWLIYRQAMERARLWYGIVEVLIKQADQEAAASTAPPGRPVSAPALSAVPRVADELKKLAELRAMGVLSEAEFAQQKAKLLAG